MTTLTIIVFVIAVALTVFAFKSSISKLTKDHDMRNLHDEMRDINEINKRQKQHA